MLIYPMPIALASEVTETETFDGTNGTQVTDLGIRTGNYAIDSDIVAITNEYAGSDGDIFSHSFKLMKLGKLIGKRTWGGVIGIWPRNLLVDGTVTTQPEFSFWFKDVGWDVENYGTEVNIEVDITPEDYSKGVDTQLDKAISEVLKDLKKNPVKKPKFDNKPNLSN